VIEIYTPDIINLYYAFIFNFILWVGMWLTTFTLLAAVALAIR